MPETARIVPIVFAIVIFSLRNNIPITKAKIIEVSLIAITTGIGAFENAHITMQYAANDDSPPPKKTHLALPNILTNDEGDTFAQ